MATGKRNRRRTPRTHQLVQIAFGRRVRKLRRGKGWSQERLAEECDLHRTYVGGIERGERNVSLVNIHRVADSLGVAIEELFAEEKLI